MKGRLSPEDILKTVGKYEVAVLKVAVTVLACILEDCDIDKQDLRSLRVCYTGGEPVSPALLEDYAKRGIAISQIYCQPERSTLMWLSIEDALRKRGSIGKPVFHGDVEIVHNDGQQIGPGEIGEILVSDYINMNGYWEKPELTEDIIGDGWLHTGDLATNDNEAFIYIVDSKKDMFMTGGENVYPAVIDKVLLENRKLLNAGVCAIPDQKWGEVGMASIILQDRESMKEAEAIAFCDGKFARYKTTKVIRSVGELPMAAAQKNMRRELREDYLAVLKHGG